MAGVVGPLLLELAPPGVVGCAGTAVFWSGRALALGMTWAGAWFSFSPPAGTVGDCVETGVLWVWGVVAPGIPDWTAGD